jgi:hypothetical protein
MLILREPHKHLELTHGAEGWRDFLAHPPRHWRDNRSARRLALAWEGSAPKAPPAMAAAFAGTPFEGFAPIIAIPAYEVDMPGSRAPARNDLLVVGQTGSELALLMVQGKVDATLGPHIDEWLHNPSPGKLMRIGFLKRTLQLSDPLPETICYQLLHRTAAPLLEASRLGMPRAAVVVAAFGPSDECFGEFEDFTRLLGLEGRRGHLERSPLHRDPELWLGWVDMDGPDAGDGGGDVTGNHD